ncbi:hypothetical protein HK096_000070, partial [Nowakowskiella sp. JEL0078]
MQILSNLIADLEIIPQLPTSVPSSPQFLSGIQIPVSPSFNSKITSNDTNSQLSPTTPTPSTVNRAHPQPQQPLVYNSFSNSDLPSFYQNLSEISQNSQLQTFPSNNSINGSAMALEQHLQGILGLQQSHAGLGDKQNLQPPAAGVVSGSNKPFHDPAILQIS